MDWKSDFPALRDRDIVYADNAATTHKPDAVIDAIAHFYRYEYAPIFRGMYRSADQATRQYEQVRDRVAAYIGASSARDIIFTKSATEGVNIVAWSWAWHMVMPDDDVVITDLEHHAHFVTWQQFAKAKGCGFKRIPVTKEGELDVSQVDSIITHKTKLVAITAESNVIGVPMHISPIVRRARACGAAVLCDATQRAPRSQLAVHEAGYDFCVFSPHKMLGPTGLGVLYVAPERQGDVQPYLYGGGMVQRVALEESSWRQMPYRCEAGSPPSAQVIGFGAALSYLQNVSFNELQAHEAQLCSYLIEQLEKMSQLRIIGPIERIKQEGHLVSFWHEEMNAHDIALYLDSYNICVRSGHHCAQPLHNVFNIQNTVRISLYGYNTIDDVRQVAHVLESLE